MPEYMIAQKIYEQRYLHRLIRETLVKLIAPDFQVGHRFSTDFFGMTWVGDSSQYLDFQILLRGAYEKFMLFFMRDLLEKSGTAKVVLDVGANLGNHSLYTSQFASKVHAFEPYPLFLQTIEEKIRVNNISNLMVHPIGLSDMKDMVPYVPGRSGSTTGSFKDGFVSKNQNSVMLSVDTGDAVVREKNISGIDIIKIDVDGFEKKVLIGFQETLSTQRPVVIFETFADTRGENRSDYSYLQSLFPSGYLFFEFSKRNKKNGNYALRRVTSKTILKTNDVVAFPEERNCFFIR